MTTKQWNRIIRISAALTTAQEVMWWSQWPFGHCAVSALLLAPSLRAPTEIDFRVVIGRCHDNRMHAWIESPEGDIIDPTYGQFAEGEALRWLRAHDAGRLGHEGELKLTLDQEEFYRRAIVPSAAPPDEVDGWIGKCGIKKLFSDHPRLPLEIQ